MLLPPAGKPAAPELADGCAEAYQEETSAAEAEAEAEAAEGFDHL